MKKMYIYLIIVLIVFFILPAVTTRKKKETNVSTNKEAQEQEIEEILPKKNYEYSKYKTIKLYHTKTGEIEEIPMDEYLYGVVSAEIPASYEIEAIKAQAVAARTYTIYQILNSNQKHSEADICDNYACCQAWISKEERLSRWEEEKAESNWNKICSAVNVTSGEIITYNGEPIDAFFHSNSGGVTETAKNVWGGNNFPYLQSVQTSGEDKYSEYSSKVEISKQDLINKLKEKHPDLELNFNENECVEITEYTESGRVRTIKFGNIFISGTEARKILGLKSTNFVVEITENTVKFKVKGYGHGVGMSQTGADSLAKENYSYQDILKHYYIGVEISNESSLN